MPVDERSLRYYRAVYAGGSIRRAARELRIGPSVVSRQIAELERRLGVPLFERTARGVSPTAFGEALARFARDRAHLDELLDEEIDQLRGLRRGVVRLLAGEGFIEDLLSHGLAGFMLENPTIQVVLETAGTAAMRDRLLDDEADLALALHAPPHRDLRSVAQAVQPLAVICASGHDLAQREEVAPADLKGLPTAIMPAGFGIRALTDQLQRNHDVVFDARLETSSIRAMKAFVLASLGYCLLPRFAVHEELRERRLVARALIAEDLKNVRAQLLVRDRRRLSVAAGALSAHLADQLESLNET